MSNDTDVRMEILFQGQTEAALFVLNGEDAARFGQEYRLWIGSGSPAGEFQYQESGHTVYIRFDPIITRRSISVADHNQQHTESMKTWMEVNR